MSVVREGRDDEAWIVVGDDDDDRTAVGVQSTQPRIALHVATGRAGRCDHGLDVGGHDLVEPHLVLRVPAETHCHSFPTRTRDLYSRCRGSTVCAMGRTWRRANRFVGRTLAL